jgi:xylulokinase
VAPDSPDILAVDVGTSSLKAVVYGQQGNIIASAAQRYTYRADQPGWAECLPEDWWAAFEAAVGDLARQGAALRALRAVAFTGQMHTAVLLDRAGQPLPPTILWLDRRAAAETEELRATLKLPPHQINSTYSLPKLLWLRRHRPEVLDQTCTILWPKDYLRYRLTGVICTDLTEAGGAALLDWSDQSWAANRLELPGLDASVLPRVRPADDIVGPPCPALAEALGINKDAQVVVGMGDVAALISGAPPKPGRLVCSMGSSSMIFMALGDDQRPVDPRDRLYTYPFLRPYRLFGGVSSTTGAALVWAYENLARFSKMPEASFESVVQEAVEAGPGADGLCFVPFLAGERSPYWCDEIRAGFYGLRLSHSRPHLMRAVLESQAYSLRYLLDIYAELGLPVDEIALAGGGTNTPGLPQIVADVCRQAVGIYSQEETVTRVLYALCTSALGRAGFDETLAGTFAAPRVVQCRPDAWPAYETGYERYQRFAAFAREEAAKESDLR